MTVQIEYCSGGLSLVPPILPYSPDHIEFCSALELGGLTPSLGSTGQLLELTSIPVRVLIREREGDFHYSSLEKSAMLRSMEHLEAVGVDKFVLGALNDMGEIDLQYLKRVRSKFKNAEITFHRAIDQVSDVISSLQILIDEGVDRVLTSGTATSAYAGRDMLKQMVQISAGSIRVAAAGGIDEKNVAGLVEHTGIGEVHLSAVSYVPAGNRVALANSAGLDSTPLADTQKFESVTRIVRRMK